MTMYISPIKPKRISDQVFDQIEELIFRGQLKPGEQLMPERELSEILNVSRTTVRDAIRRLTAKGLICQTQGKGTFVRAYEDKLQNPLAMAIQAKDVSLENLLEVRIGLESTAASLAALRADESDIMALEKSYKEMNEERDSNRLGSHADTSFHMAIAFASKNPLHILIMRNFYDYLFHGIRENLEFLYENPENIQAITEQHKTILEAIKKRDDEQAYTQMKTHIKFVTAMIQNRLNP
ncbi:MAG: FadR/GntR family transcriptional regulator [Pseudomonadota bacterium]